MKTNKGNDNEMNVSAEQKKRQPVSFEWAIRNVLCRKENYDVTEGFLNELLGRRVKVVSIVENECKDDCSFDEFNSVDIALLEENDETVMVKLQFYYEADCFRQMLFGASKTLVENIKPDVFYIQVKKVYSVSIIYSSQGYGTDYLYSGKASFTGMHNNKQLLLSPSQSKLYNGPEAGDMFPQYYILQINKFNSVPANTLDEWFYFLKHYDIQEGFSAMGLLKAYEVMDYNSLSLEERVNYDCEQKVRNYLRCHIDAIRDEEKTKAEMEVMLVLEEKDSMIEEKDKIIEEQKRTIEKDKRILKEMKRIIAKQARKLDEYKHILNIE
jgi:hypothetical protein